MEFVTTGDGSKTLYHEAIGEHYHSKHGALQESKHVFVQAGLAYFFENNNTNHCAILEIGFGTGLNFLTTSSFVADKEISIDYCGVEAFPLDESIAFSTGYDAFVSADIWSSFTKHYAAAQVQSVPFNSQINLQIAVSKIMDFQSDKKFDVVYFDAFAAVHQPEMWTDETLTHVCQFLKPGGVFVTYAITGQLKRSMKALGFSIEKAPGAPGKREMLRAVKNS